MGKAAYIKCSGNNYVDTGFTPNGNTKIVIDCKLDSSATGNQPICGARSAASSNTFTLWGISSAKLRFDYGTTQNASSAYTPKDRHVYTMSAADGCLVDGTSIKTLSVASFNAPCTLALSAVNTAGSITYGKYIIYSCKIYDNGTLIKDYVPWLDDSGVYCLYDNVNKQYVYSATSTALDGSLTAPVDITKDIFKIKTGLVMDCPYSGKVQSIVLPKGKYKLEVWGAQGGYRSGSSYGGKGGYSVGTLTLEKETTVYIYSGGAGNTVTTKTSSIYPGGFNGGGYRYNYKGGGGASDIRIGKDSLLARVIVAGGGGSDGASSYAGGAGGGTSGVNGSGGCYSTYKGSGGTQTGNSDGHTCNTSQGTSNSSANCPGGFGFGGFGVYYASGYGGAGGGGWYGGEGTYPDGSVDDDYGGGGGSGYIYTSSTASNYPSGCLLNSSHYLTDAQTINGATAFTSPSGASETGHTGDGYCRITVIECQNTQINIRINNSIKKASSFYAKIGGNWKKLVNSFSNLSVGEVLNFPYSGSVQTITLPAGQYKLECWGAQGGQGADGTTSNTSWSYGKGGYSSGVLSLEDKTVLFIYSGGHGWGYQGSTHTSGLVAGGFNGGGNAYHDGGEFGGSGGGASDIRINNDSLYARVIVAGGGGGSGEDNESAGYGGGISSSGYSSSYQASQTNAGTNGSFGQGANYKNSGESGGGGGGGWYGGGGGEGSGSGGGSGYVYTASTASNYPSGCLLNSSYYLTDASTIAGNTSFTSPTGTSETGHTGDGYCRITVLSIESQKENIKMYVKNNSWKQISI